MKFVLASNNAGKIQEFQQLLQPIGIEVLPQATLDVKDIEETGLSFVENAILKARHACEQTGLPALADDSGLAVEALQGAPGIYSARYASTAEACNQKLLAALGTLPDAERKAAYYCILVYMKHANDPVPLICQGKWEGVIAKTPQGTSGFGYDPIFFVPSEQKTAAELPPSIKNRLSHRGQAMRLLLASMDSVIPAAGAF